MNGVACFAGSLFGVPSGEVFSSVSPYSMDMYLSLFFLVHIRHLLSPSDNAKALEKQKNIYMVLRRFSAGHGLIASFGRHLEQPSRVKLRRFESCEWDR